MLLCLTYAGDAIDVVLRYRISLVKLASSDEVVAGVTGKQKSHNQSAEPVCMAVYIKDQTLTLVHQLRVCLYQVLGHRPKSLQVSEVERLCRKKTSISSFVTYQLHVNQQFKHPTRLREPQW